MPKEQKESQHPDLDRTKTDDRGDTRRRGEGPTNMREANENIRKSLGEDAGPRPVIDRHR